VTLLDGQTSLIPPALVNDRAFSVAGLWLWNNMLPDVRQTVLVM